MILAKVCKLNAPSPEKIQSAIEVERLLRRELTVDTADPMPEPAQGLSWWQRHITPKYYEGPIGWRVTTTVQLPTFRWVNDPVRFAEGVSLGPLPAEAIFMTDHHGRTLLHAVAQSIYWVTSEAIGRADSYETTRQRYIDMLEGRSDGFGIDGS